MSDLLEQIEWALAVHFSQNRQPHMSGDPRERLSLLQRRNMEDARDAVIEALGIPTATLLGLRDGTLVAVPRKLLTEAHACMRACGWQLAPAAEQQGDGVLQLAVAEVEAAFLDLLAAAPEAPGRG